MTEERQHTEEAVVFQQVQQMSKKQPGWWFGLASLILTLLTLTTIAVMQWGERGTMSIVVQGDVKELEQKVEKNVEKIEKVNEKIHNVELQVSGVLGSVASTKVKVDSIEKEINSLVKGQETIQSLILQYRIGKK